jgi:hypothetical protein
MQSLQDADVDVDDARLKKRKIEETPKVATVPRKW